ncbi:urease accessory protein UreF [Psychrobacter arenosus]|uniref:urease accessory protein UreF n=1 Tax=Psychrobacter arenosus TaxID=256326 RepID=UPI001D0FBA9B|nr:urease accessory UreF family protein [Psychrobacter arenosus]
MSQNSSSSQAAELLNIENNSNQLGALLMFASSNLPIGSYTYSQGVEAAIEAGLIYNEESMLAWMQDYQSLALMGFELPLIVALAELLARNETELADELAAYYMASRESHEFVLETSQLAHALGAWVEAVLDLTVPESIRQQGFLPLFAHICQHHKMSHDAIAMAYGFGQLENMVLAAVKTVPLGQMAGQRILWQLQAELQHELPILIKETTQTVISWLNKPQAMSKNEQEIPVRKLEISILIARLTSAGNLPNLAMLSCQHEQQYSRLFRS